ncbi:alpha/beta hydrolase fold domain-containing protein [Flexivirga meconopsidis]|uniref:alpha/beta hydrolase fold domain-containing protein n=1 Tax=Flexivirga meconopsidis TaxID=2977121 RepID=UPI0031344696
MTSVLMVLSAAHVWTLRDGTLHPTGVWAEEFVVPYELFTAAGFDVTVATPGGKEPVIDKLSLGISGGLPAKTRKIGAEAKRLAPVLEHPANLSDVDQVDYDLVFYSGGHGPMEDLAVDETSGALLSARLASGRPLALLCHAPAASLAARSPDGSWPFAGYRMTGLSNREERLNPFAWKAKWLLEDRLKESGADYSKGFPLRPHIVVDRNLYTGQNPQSSEQLAKQLIAVLAETQHPFRPSSPTPQGVTMSELPPPITPYLEPEAKELADATDPHPRIYEVPPEEGRKILSDLQSGEGVERPDVDEQWVDVDAGEWGTVRTRIIRAKGVTGDLPGLFYIHGAGWVFGDEHTHDRLFRELTVGAGAVGIFPVYDRAPEKGYPTQVEQNYAVGQWVAQHGAEYGIDTSRLAVTGESVGGCMSAVFALMNKDRGGLALTAEALLYPVTNADFDTPSYLQFAEGYYLTRDGMKWFWDAYTTDPEKRKEKYAAPLQASLDELRGLPRTLVITDEADVLRDEGEQYANKLREAGVDVTSMRVAGMVHDFLLLDSLRDTKAANLARQVAIDFLHDALN